MAKDQAPLKDELLDAALNFCVLADWFENEARVERMDEGELYLAAERRMRMAAEQLLFYQKGKRRELLAKHGVEYTTLKAKQDAKKEGVR